MLVWNCWVGGAEVGGVPKMAWRLAVRVLAMLAWWFGVAGSDWLGGCVWGSVGIGTCGRCQLAGFGFRTF